MLTPSPLGDKLATHKDPIMDTMAQFYKEMEPNNMQYNHRRYLMEKYGLTAQEVIAVDKVSFCPICKMDLGDGKLRALDHDHGTNKIRGVLCHYCNRMVVGPIERAAKASGLTLAVYVENLTEYFRTYGMLE